MKEYEPLVHPNPTTTDVERMRELMEKFKEHRDHTSAIQTVTWRVSSDGEKIMSLCEFVCALCDKSW